MKKLAFIKLDVSNPVLCFNNGPGLYCESGAK